MSILIFAGTTEGHALAAFCAHAGLVATVCVATEYGELVLPSMPHMTVRRGRLDEMQMRALMQTDTLVIDATHPYAGIVTQNIRAAATAVGASYVRLVRPRTPINQEVVTVPDTAAAAEYLCSVTGSALLTTGSKELAAFTKVERFAERLWPRVLPTAEVLEKCTALGFPGAHIVAMQGPFSKELNIALLRQAKAKYLVTKDTGTAGGFAEKIEAAKEAGAIVILISRPTEEQGLMLAEVQEMLKTRYNLMDTPPTEARFPLFVSLKDKICVVVGAGRIAQRRAQTLKRFGAKVRVIAPEARSIEPTEKKRYEESDLLGAFLVIAATDQREINCKIAKDCRKADTLCSIADCAEESTFFFPALCEAGNLIAGVTSDGSDHAQTAKAAACIRRVLAEITGEV